MSEQPTETTEEGKVVIKVEDDRTGMSPAALKRAVLDHLTFTRSKDVRSATVLDVCFALAYTVRDRLIQRWVKTQRTYQQEDPKRLYYLSAEFLVGRFLGNNLINLGLYEWAKRGLAEYDLELSQVLEEEHDPGLGNGGLGRLAACYLDSMATLELPGYGYGIRYEFGIFRQEIENGWQIEQPDEWNKYGYPWEVARPEYTTVVRFGGRVVQADENGRLRARWVDGHSVLGVPYDMPIAGYGNNTVNTLRLWQARASEQFDLKVFNDGDYRRAVEQKALSESISKVLYPKDDSLEGKELRLKQQYFFTACSLSDIVRRFKKNHESFDEFPDKVAIQLNDTHPAIAVPELMRVLVDVEGLDWERAWDITRRTLAYTNHTLLPEALEKWPLDLIARLLPRHLQLIYEINHRFLREVHIFAPGDSGRKQRMSIIEEGNHKQVRMAHLAVVGSHSINGVAELHSQLVREQVLRDFAELWPERFNNKTNGVTPRRWLLLCNPDLAAAITRRIGDGWVTQLDQLEGLERFADDEEFLDELRQIKRTNKLTLARIIEKRHGVVVDPDSLFDVQVKRIHEYKRQLLNCLHVIHLYRKLKFDNAGDDIVPRTFIFGGKAAPGYAQAKKHVKLINDVAEIVNSDRSLGGRIKCVFMANYNVSLAERIIPAADLSEQISMAGKEASGTGNMKFQMNGALTIGTLDGANIEIRQEVGDDNFFLFGLDANQVRECQAQGYSPEDYIARSPALRQAIELIERGVFSPHHPSLHSDVVHYIRHQDPYLICADFDAYVATQEQAALAYTDSMRWTEMTAHNIARAGKFSSDRAIRQYASEIWNTSPVHIELDPYMPPA
ncbi:MAG: glycogen/starch/alpha-glucan phosphorylase [Proteobacteria bacterium]|nr:glycogen/starch/alpha-glucan phosphorylase [Pseudomonadota bacterium]